MRPELEKVVAALLARTPPGGAIGIDAVGEAIGTRAVTPPEIEEMLRRLEALGRKIEAPEGQRGAANLKRVLAAARELRAAGEAPRAEVIAARTGLTREEVEHALGLAKVMQR